jgi:anti-sigma factor RsiW
MRCQHVQDKLQEYLDGQLPPSEARTVEAHLAECAACQGDLALLRQVDDALATLPLLEESANFTARVMARVRATGPSALGQRPVLKGTRDSGQASPVSLPSFRLRWEDAVVSFAFACAAMAVLSAVSLLQPQHVSAARAFLHRAWWTFLPELGRLWHAVQMEPIYAVWGLSSLCVAVAAAASAIVLVRQWQRWSVAMSRRR